MVIIKLLLGVLTYLIAGFIVYIWFIMGDNRIFAKDSDGSVLVVLLWPLTLAVFGLIRLGDALSFLDDVVHKLAMKVVYILDKFKHKSENEH